MANAFQESESSPGVSAVGQPCVSTQEPLTPGDLAVLHTFHEQLISKTAELEKAQEALKVNFENSLKFCYRLLNAYDPLLGDQTRMVVDICTKMAKSKYFTDQEKQAFIAAAWLHDIGLIGLDRNLLQKLRYAPSSVSTNDKAAFRLHPVRSQELATFFDNLRGVGETIRAHHEHFDGLGYPDGFAGETIPWTARCLAIAVYFVECGLPKTQALDSILKHSGSSFDPEAVRLFFKMTQSADLPHQVREVMVDELTPGMKPVKGIYNTAGLLLVPEELPLTAAAIEKIKNHSLLVSITDRLLVHI